MLRVVVLVSGGGTNLQAIIDAIAAGKVTNAQIVGVISNNKTVKSLERARNAGIPAVCVSPKDYESREVFNDALLAKVKELTPDLIVLAGFLVKIPEAMVHEYSNRIINIHPAYLPEFPGAHGIEDAWNAGVAQSGVTIHWVDSGVDTGKVIKQVRVPRLEGDTLDTFETRIHETEYKLYPEVLDSLGVARK